MKEIRGKISRLVGEIIGIWLIVIMSILIWPNYSYSMVNENKKSNNELSLDLINMGDSNDLLPMSNDNALKNVEPSQYTISNLYNESKGYKFYIKIYKPVEIPVLNLNISVEKDENLKIINLASIPLTEEDDFVIFTLDNGVISEMNYQNIKIRLWLDSSATNEIMGKSLSYTYGIENDSNIAYN